MREISIQNIAFLKRRLLNRGQSKRHHYISLPVNNSKLTTTDFFPFSIINRVLSAQKFFENGISNRFITLGYWPTLALPTFHKSYLYIRYSNHTDLLTALGLDVQYTWAARSAFAISFYVHVYTLSGYLFRQQSMVLKMSPIIIEIE